MTTLTDELVPGRACDGCTLCCKLLEIDVLKKPRGRWCPHCDKSKGCTIYETRPEPCRSFHCGYLRIAHLDDRWKPSKAKFFINYENQANRIAIHVDPDRPDAWRKEPFYNTIRGWAAAAGRGGSYVIVWQGGTATIVLPDREKGLGIVRDDQLILQTVNGPQRDFVIIEPDDPRAQTLR